VNRGQQLTTSDTATSMNRLSIVAVLVTLILWASAFPAIRAGLEAYSPGHLALLRYLIASVVLLLCAIPARVRVPARNDWPRLALIGVIGVSAYNVLLNYGEQTVPAGEASLLVNTAPVFTALLATIFLGERLKFAGWLGLAISFTGAALIAIGRDGFADGLKLEAGALLVLAAAVVQALYFVLQRPLTRRYKPLEITTAALLAGTVGLLPFAPGLVEAIERAPISATMAVVYLGVFPAAIGYLAWSVVLSAFSATRAASFLYAVPAIAFVISWVWLGEAPNALALVGGTLALGGVILLNTLGRSK
jgi:drug/metabolite transporter (DMT)-like permease